MVTAKRTDCDALLAPAKRADRGPRGLPRITSQVPVNRWDEVIGDPTLADAILDRIIHRTHRLDLKGPPRSTAASSRTTPRRKPRNALPPNLTLPLPNTNPHTP